RLLDITDLVDRKPKQLSGGQRQRVAIGRAIVREPKVFLFDEPLSNLDAALRVQMRIEIAKIHRKLKTTIVYVTHDQIEAMTMASRIVVMNAGTIEQVGAPLELYNNPVNRFVAGFIGSPKMNFIAGKLVSADAQQAKVALPDGNKIVVAVDATRANAGEDVTLGIRPEHIIQRGDSSGGGVVTRVKGEVVLVENLGESALVYLELPKTEAMVLSRVEGTSSAKEGETLEIGLPARAAHLFDSAGKSFPRTVDEALEGEGERRAS
ncbi:MAG TPA: TOBE domain-containing protein, partial [Kofleriaceae bacterium]|nr:TOBE domain-containing protein [Kofleriaceae bacterium]